ncbi:MAG: hypothetical protein U1E48_08760 [Paracoccaceae bacterium]
MHLLQSKWRQHHVAFATDLRTRILFTLALLIVYRLGTYIPQCRASTRRPCSSSWTRPLFHRARGRAAHLAARWSAWASSRWHHALHFLVDLQAADPR